MKTLKTLLQMNEGKIFQFTDLSPLKLRGTDDEIYPGNGLFQYLTTCEGTCPKVSRVFDGKEFILSSDSYYREVLPV